jgi:hypothetical protein
MIFFHHQLTEVQYKKADREHLTSNGWRHLKVKASKAYCYYYYLYAIHTVSCLGFYFRGFLYIHASVKIPSMRLRVSKPRYHCDRQFVEYC